TLQVLGSSVGDTFKADASAAKLLVNAAGGGLIQATNIQYLIMDDPAGGNFYTINDLAGTGIQHIYLNPSEVAKANGPADHIGVNGSATTTNTVVVSANPNVQGIVSNDPTASGQATDVDLTMAGDDFAGKPGAHYVVTAAIPKSVDDLTINTGNANDTVS